MTEDKTPPTPSEDGSKKPDVAKQLSAICPKIVRLVTRLGQIYEVGQRYPALADNLSCRSIEGEVIAIWEEEGWDEGAIYRVQTRLDDERFKGSSLMDSVPGEMVADLARLYDKDTLDALEQTELSEPDMGIDGWRVIESLGGVAALVYEVGKISPELPPPHNGLRGKVIGIVRTEEDTYRVRIAVPASELVPENTVVAVEVFSFFSAVELLSDEAIDKRQEDALTAAINALEEDAEGDDDDDEGEGDDEP